MSIRASQMAYWIFRQADGITPFKLDRQFMKLQLKLLILFSFFLRISIYVCVCVWVLFFFSYSLREKVFFVMSFSFSWLLQIWFDLNQLRMIWDINNGTKKKPIRNTFILKIFIFSILFFLFDFLIWRWNSKLNAYV